jgi:hypothetical protein
MDMFHCEECDEVVFAPICDDGHDTRLMDTEAAIDMGLLDEEDEDSRAILWRYLIDNDWEGHALTVYSVGQELGVTLKGDAATVKVLTPALRATLTQTGDYEITDAYGMTSSDGTYRELTLTVKAN